MQKPYLIRLNKVNKIIIGLFLVGVTVLTVLIPLKRVDLDLQIQPRQLENDLHLAKPDSHVVASLSHHARQAPSVQVASGETDKQAVAACISNIRSKFQEIERGNVSLVVQIQTEQCLQVVHRIASPSPEDIGRMSEVISQELSSFKHDAETYKSARTQAMEMLNIYTYFQYKYKYLHISAPSAVDRPISVMLAESNISTMQEPGADNVVSLPRDGPLHFSGENLAAKNSGYRQRYGYLFDLFDTEKTSAAK